MLTIQCPTCTFCNRKVTRLVPLYDANRNTMICHDCKRKIKKGLEIKKFTRSEEK